MDQTLSQLLGSIPTNLCGGSSCTASAVNFAMCPNNGFCTVSVNLTSATNSSAIYRKFHELYYLSINLNQGVCLGQMFLLAPGFNSFILPGQTPPGIAVVNNQNLNSTFQNFITATYIRTTSRLAFTDASNNVYYYDTTGKVSELTEPTS